MGLEILFNKTDNFHENVQFDRVALHLVPFFEEQGWHGLLIGNPVSEDYPRFRADAILFYSNGLIIIDFKDYRGEIVMPPKDDDFRTEEWFNNTLTGDRIKIEAGNNHTNPYKQLDRYRGVMKSIIRDDKLLRYVIDENKVCALNIFSGPITLNRETSRAVPYYQLKSELDLHSFLNQYASQNKYEEPIADRFKVLFPAEKWKGDLSIDPDTYYARSDIKHQQIDENILPALEEFYNTDDSSILVLESMDQRLRDDWMKMVNTYALENGSSETDIWCHSSRIARKVNLRTQFDVFSLYAVLYTGNVKSAKKEEEDSITDDENSTDESELSQSVIGFKCDNDIDENATIIIPEAHLVSRSLHQSDLMKFGTGRLLEDLIQFLRLDQTNRKVIFIGDPYMLSYGKVEDCALNVDTLNEVFPDGNIISYRHIPEKKENDIALLSTRKALGNSIDQKYYNRLNYEYDASFLLAEHNDGLNYIREWFSSPLKNEPKHAVLFF
ncbi:ATP-dependent exoDNAse [Nonlabens ulvanivorans]|uniref:ATP-dependent exoDNAse n=1 Tax=Nonlabens ulvanivorans TaxID=906888 RepID=A0A090X2B3_NONUL|nr:nuclease-related domain-containing protein [Nonlabens ulvanivorans]GAL74317.1 ATP-dependent exoDNAse [Nonlabens ulvanivorans]